MRKRTLIENRFGVLINVDRRRETFHCIKTEKIKPEIEGRMNSSLNFSTISSHMKGFIFVQMLEQRKAFNVFI